jgi:hypothetical protein
MIRSEKPKPYAALLLQENTYVSLINSTIMTLSIHGSQWDTGTKASSKLKKKMERHLITTEKIKHILYMYFPEN